MQREAAFGSRGDCSSSRWSSEGGSWHGLPGSALPSGLVQGPDWGTQPHLQVRVVPAPLPFHFGAGQGISLKKGPSSVPLAFQIENL